MHAEQSTTGAWTLIKVQDIQHKLWELVMKGDLYWAPIGKPQNVLDIVCSTCAWLGPCYLLAVFYFYLIWNRQDNARFRYRSWDLCLHQILTRETQQGTGTGIWAINFAKQHPQAKVTGTDLSLIQPVTAPSNCVFVREDCEEEWVFEHKFDFVHLRTMFTCFNDPRGVMQKIYDNLEPGGWVEYEDSALEFIGVDAEAEEYVRASPVAQWMDLMKRGLWNAVGRDIAVALKYKQWMAEIGFTDVVEKPVLCPVNSWPLDPVDREIGHFCRLDMERALDSTVKMLLAGGLTQEELPAFKESVRWSLGDRNLRGYFIGKSIVICLLPRPS